ncbi:MAG: hypothetical protein AAF629_18370 [Chloroflexota bacterium]
MNDIDKIEYITPEEYHHLSYLLKNAVEAELDDYDLQEFGNHRDLYTYLTQTMGLSVQAGRGPVWHRAKALIEKHEQQEEAKR